MPERIVLTSDAERKKDDAATYARETLMQERQAARARALQKRRARNDQKE